MAVQQGILDSDGLKPFGMLAMFYALKASWLQSIWEISSGLCVC